MKKKTLLFKNDNVLYYDDLTYRCEHWESGDYSYWKIDEGGSWFKHKEHREWQLDKQCADLEDLRQRYEEAIYKMMEKAFKFDE